MEGIKKNPHPPPINAKFLCFRETVSSKLSFFCYEQFSLLHLILKLMVEVRGHVVNVMAMPPAKLWQCLRQSFKALFEPLGHVFRT